MAQYKSKEYDSLSYDQQPPYGQATAPGQEPPLPPLPVALGINREYVAAQPELLMMREGWSWAGDQFRVTAADGREILHMNAKVWSLSSRKEFLSHENNLLFTLRRRLFEIPQSFYLEDARGNEFLNIDGQWSFRTKLAITFVNQLAPDGPHPVRLEVRGDWIDRKADITWDGMIVAKIRRQFRNWRELSARHTYGVEVAPGVDLAMIAALVVAIDEDRRKSNN